jgi:hypothetical protein
MTPSAEAEGKKRGEEGGVDEQREKGQREKGGMDSKRGRPCGREGKEPRSGRAGQI